MNLIEKINDIAIETKKTFKPDLKKYGKNFRAISESALLEVLNPKFQELGIAYEVLVKRSELRIEKINCGRDQAGNLIEKLVFVAEVVVRLVFHNPENHNTDGTYYETLEFEGCGCGIDAGDKATGKAFTAAVKYALFKGLRLQYSDDPDAEASEDIENIIPEAKSENSVEKIHKSEKKAEKEEPLASAKQLDYIKGLVKSSSFTDEDFKKKFGFLPYDSEVLSKLTMRKAREVISFLEDLPF